MKNLIVLADTHGGKNTALKRALQIQSRTGAHITLFGFCYTSSNNSETSENADKVKALLMEKRAAELNALIADFDASADDITAEVVWSKDIAGELLARRIADSADLIVKSAHKTGSWFHTSTDWQLIRESKIPLMITAGKTWKKKSRILATIDFASTEKTKQRLNDKIIANAKALVGPLGDNSIHIAFALTAPQALIDLDLIDAKKYLAEKRKSLQAVVDQFCEKHGISKENVHIKQGEPERVIPSIANDLKADLTIVGTIGRKGLKGKLIGNTAEGILGRLYTDILTIRP
ncbi:MAG: universal stress protein E [Zhongshania marina]|jgi:universal stress protein E|uniref:Universal stress protein UspA n=1 Tax=Zhongshania marina TaxID=2304603 RepID=A0A2S4HJX5_9GAMM|nr:universal stress protein [Marortus luteolus]POP54283.1 universal stress protein UspA [Marortus luteolus]RNL61763.1 universal stress protein UspA [Zhongshania marina]